ncbi:hypothetical protein Tco_0608855, partial [Tanacetum coccineum]
VDQDIDVEWQDGTYHLVDEPEEISDMFVELDQAMDELDQVIKDEYVTYLFDVYDQIIDDEGDVVPVEVVAEVMVSEEAVDGDDGRDGKKPEPNRETRNQKFFRQGEECLSGYEVGFGALMRIFIGFRAGTRHKIPNPPRP